MTRFNYVQGQARQIILHPDVSMCVWEAPFEMLETVWLNDSSGWKKQYAVFDIASMAPNNLYFRVMQPPHLYGFSGAEKTVLRNDYTSTVQYNALFSDVADLQLPAGLIYTGQFNSNTMGLE